MLRGVEKGFGSGMKYKIRSFFEIIQELSYILNERQKRKCFFVLTVIIISSFFNMLGISALLPFIQGLMEIDGLNATWYGGIIIALFGISDNYMILVILGSFIVIIYLLKNLFLFWSIKIQTRFRCNITKELSVKIFNSYMRRPYNFFLDINSAEFMRGINDDVDGIFNLLKEFFILIKNVSSSLFIGMFIIYSDFIMAAGLLLISCICIIGIQLIFGSQLRKLSAVRRAAYKEQYQSAYQAVSGIKDIKVMQRSEYFIDQYAKAYDKKAFADYGYGVIEDAPARVLEVSCVFALVVTLCIRIRMGTDVAVFIPKLAAFALAVFQTMPMISGISSGLNALSYKKVSLDAAYNNLREVSEYEEGQKGRRNIVADNEHSADFTGSIVVNRLNWRYSETGRQILDNVNLHIDKGESVALIGASGSGKTTLADIILGLLEPEQGQVLMDGIDVYSIPKKWSETIGYVPQSVFLLDDTVRNNVLFGKTDEETDDQKVWEALEKAQLKEHIMSLPDKLDTMVGERGVKLSGGQRQRVAIARALYYNPEILVLDEATSALDSETEQAVMEAIDRLHGNKTLIIVAHRLSTIKNCDRIYEIENGVAVERNKDDICFIEGKDSTLT